MTTSPNKVFVNVSDSMEKLKKLSDEDAEEKIEKTKVSKERAAVAAQRAHEIKKRRPGKKVFELLFLPRFYDMSCLSPE